MKDSTTTQCAGCKQYVPTLELDADDRCMICQSLARLRDTLIKSGKLHPNLFEKADNRQLPPGDRD